MNNEEFLEKLTKEMGLWDDRSFIGNHCGNLYFCNPANPEIWNSEPFIFEPFRSISDAIKVARHFEFTIKFTNDKSKTDDDIINTILDSAKVRLNYVEGDY